MEQMIKCYLIKEGKELIAAKIDKNLCSTLIDSLNQKEEEYVYLSNRGQIKVTGIIIPSKKADYKLILMPENTEGGKVNENEHRKA